MNAERGVGKLPAEFAHFVHKEFQGFNLDVRSRKAIDNGSMLILRTEQFT